jgi:homoserine kinase
MMVQGEYGGSIRLRLPATSANLGAGFDALGLALSFYLTIEAVAADSFHIEATGRDAELCAKVEDNLILSTFTDVLAEAGVLAPRLHLKIENQIPLGMGCGSSAAALSAGVMLANHFGALNWNRQQILEEACRREGHPDNVAACLLGGMTASAMVNGRVITATCGNNLNWKFYLARPSDGLATSKARAMLPASYSRGDAVENIQSVALLVSAFHSGQGELLRAGMRDRIHQPYRIEACPLLKLLLPLGEDSRLYGVALSGAGPSVLVIAPEDSIDVPEMIRQTVGDSRLEVIEAGISGGAETQAMSRS